MKIFPIHKAKTHLSKLISLVLNGEVVILARGKEPLVKLVPLENKNGRKFGAMRGKAVVGDAFFEPLPEDELKSWE